MNGKEIFKTDEEIVYDGYYKTLEGNYLFYNNVNNMLNVYVFDGKSLSLYYNFEDVKYVKPIVSNDVIMGFTSFVDDKTYLYSLDNEGFTTLGDVTLLADKFRNNIIQELIDNQIPDEKVLTQYINEEIDRITEGYDLSNIERNRYQPTADTIDKICKNLYKVKLKGITILVVKNVAYYSDLKQSAVNLIQKYNLDDDAIGIMFVDNVENIIKISRLSRRYLGVLDKKDSENTY